VGGSTVARAVKSDYLLDQSRADSEEIQRVWRIRTSTHFQELEGSPGDIP